MWISTCWERKIMFKVVVQQQPPMTTEKNALTGCQQYEQRSTGFCFKTIHKKSGGTNCFFRYFENFRFSYFLNGFGSLLP